MTWNVEKVENALEAVVKKATTDAAFRKQALENPAAAVKDVTGEDLPAGYVLRFVDNAKASLTVVLPDLASGEMSDSDLEAVAGGAAKPGGVPFNVPGGKLTLTGIVGTTCIA